MLHGTSNLLTSFLQIHTVLGSESLLTVTLCRETNYHLLPGRLQMMEPETGIRYPIATLNLHDNSISALTLPALPSLHTIQVSNEPVML